MITAADDNDDPLSFPGADQNAEHESKTPDEVDGETVSPLGVTERESHADQMITATSSQSAVATTTSDHNQRRQLPSINGPASRSNVVQNHHLALTYYTHHEHLHPIMQQQQETRLAELPTHHYRSASFQEQHNKSTLSSGQDPSSALYQVPIRARDAIATTLSALYGKLIVVMGIAFPMAEVISTYIPPSFYEVRGICK